MNKKVAERKRNVRKRKRKERYIRIGIIIIVGIFILWIGCVFIGNFISDEKAGFDKIELFRGKTKKVEIPVIEENLLTISPYSRPGNTLEKVKGIVVHYTANPGTSAEANRNYFEGLKDSHTTYASSHFIIGLDGEIIQSIPLDEIAYASNDRNSDTISIECCHETEDGKFNKATYQSLIKLLAWICGEYNLKEDDIIRHYDVTGKDCPRYYVKHEDRWIKLKEEVFIYIENNGEP